MVTIGQLAKKYALSRSALLYYDAQGVLKPSGRTGANYRVYSEADVEKLERILLFRNAGIPLAVIAGIIDKGRDEVELALEQRLTSINREIRRLREQQSVIVDVIKSQDALVKSRVMTKARWVAMLAAAGLDEQGMRNWHIEFERGSPEAHQDFLESIGVGEEEIRAIRNWSHDS